MKFTLFSKIEFKITDPVALIECYCFQNDFYDSYYLVPNRTVKDVNKIGARVKKEWLPQCEYVITQPQKQSLFNCSLDSILNLDDQELQIYTEEIAMVIRELKSIGLRLSQSTKVLHTVYPETIPMLDSMIQEMYKQEIRLSWRKNDSQQILLDYYNNLKQEPTHQNLLDLYDTILKYLPGLTKLDIFDILWWSYLKSLRLRKDFGINWSTIR